MRFSVVIPTRNRRVLLEQALASVWSQTHQASETIVVDDGSTDGTRNYLESLGDRVRAVYVRDRSPGAARNAGAGVATGDYVVFLDSDDLWFPWTLATFAEAIVRHGRPALLCAAFRQFRDPVELATERGGPVTAEAFPDYLSTWPRQLSVGAGMIAVRRSEFARVGGFVTAPVNLEDHDLTLRLGTAPGFVQLTQPTTLGWRRHAGSVTGDLDKSIAGCAMLIEGERTGRYPGGPARAANRRGLIATHARSVSLECARSGRLREAAQIYRVTAGWHLAMRRWKYLVTFPLLLATTWAGGRPQRAW
jgi:GT2 family glycosyltransferase